ncbi:MAG: hypothetical protein PHR06_12225 [Candidatus Cloacimonetes bacterium]|nr:hypothetical protein [Candidatus Cloacimonadota bacterium]
MKLTLKRDVTLKRKEMIAYLDIEQKREDLQSILKNPSITSLPTRLKDHLKKFGLINKYDALTESGKYAIETGLVKEKEYGQYEIWYHVDEPWFGTLPVALHRINAGNGNQDKYTNNWAKSEDILYKFSLKTDKVQSIFDSDSKNDVNLSSLTPRAVKKINEKAATGSLTCTADDVNKKEFSCKLSANLDWSQKNKEKSTISNEMTYKDDPVALIRDILGKDFDTGSKSLLIDIPPENPTDETGTKILDDKAGFKEIKIEDVPLRAKDKSCAENWLKSLLTYTWSSQYVTKEQMEIDQNKWIHSHALSGYDLTAKNTDQVLFELNENRKTFWNVAVMHDLRPANATIRIPFVLEKDESQVNFKITEHLFKGRKISRIIISDRYIENKKVSILEKLLPDDANIKITVFSREDLKSLPDNWNAEILPKIRDDEFDDHNRYWLIKSSNGWEYWSFSHSLTPFKESNRSNGIEVDAQVNISPVYTIPKYLETKIKSADGGNRK